MDKKSYTPNKRVQVEEETKENIDDQTLNSQIESVSKNDLQSGNTTFIENSELNEPIQIFLRVKPPYHSLSDNITVDSRNFQFHQIFTSNSSQLDIFESILPSLKQTFKGYNSTIFTYGQTASGKTYTITGEKNSPGIVPRVFEYMFRCFKESIGMSVLEIYNEQLTDLLEADQKKKNLMIRETIENGINVTNLTKIILENEDQAYDLYFKAIKRRKRSETYRNKESSRSHCILILWFKCLDGQLKRESRMNIVDLAGSEKIGENQSPITEPKIHSNNNEKTRKDVTRNSRKETINELLNNFSQKKVNKLNVQQKNMETGNINKSLLTLREVIKKLSKKQTDHISYRDSKLTFLLKDSLGGNSNLIVIGTIDLCFKIESLNTLQFLNMIKLIKNTPISVVQIQSNDLKKKLISVYERNKELELQINEMKSRCKCEYNQTDSKYYGLSIADKTYLNDVLLEFKEKTSLLSEHFKTLKELVKEAVNQKFNEELDYLRKIDNDLEEFSNKYSNI